MAESCRVIAAAVSQQVFGVLQMGLADDFFADNSTPAPTRGPPNPASFNMVVDGSRFAVQLKSSWLARQPTPFCRQPTPFCRRRGGRGELFFFVWGHLQ